MRVCDSGHRKVSFVRINRCGYEKIYELFVGTNKTVCHMPVSLKRGSTVLFYMPFYLSTKVLFLSVCRIEGMQERRVSCSLRVLHDFCNKCGIDYLILSSAG